MATENQNSFLKSSFERISNLGHKDHFDEFDTTSNILINQIQLLVSVWLFFFLIKDIVDLNPDAVTTFVLFTIMTAFFFIRNKISYMAAASLQLTICIFAASLEYYIHDTMLRAESLYVVIMLLATLLMPTLWTKVFFVIVTISSYLLVGYFASNYPLIMQSSLSSEDNFLLFIFASIMITMITIRYFQLIKRILRKQTNLLDELKSKNQELERFAYITSHDLKQPLRNIGSFAGLLRRFMDDPNKKEKQYEYLEQIETSTTRMSTLIEEILSFSKIDKTEISKEDISLSQIIKEFESSHSTYLEEKNAKIIYQELPIVTGNKIYLSLLFQNLIENGIKYNTSETPTVEISSQERKDEVEIAVVDNGIGISEEFSNIIFEPFQRLHSRKNYEGTGLGLSICKKIVETHDGKIKIVPRLAGTGTKFVFTFPV